MIIVDSGDYLGLVRHIARAREYPVSPELADAIVELLRKVEWSAAVEVVDSMVRKHRNELSGNTWSLLNDMIAQALNAPKKPAPTQKPEASQGTSAVPPVRRSWHMVTLQQAINEEMSKWCKTQPPLTYNGRPVEYFSGGLSSSNLDLLPPNLRAEATKHGLSLRIWEAAGRPPTWCVLNDAYWRGYSKALDREEHGQNNACDDYAAEFLTAIMADRITQLKERALTRRDQLCQPNQQP